MLRDDAEKVFMDASSQPDLNTAARSFRRVQTTAGSLSLEFCKQDGLRSADRPAFSTFSAEDNHASEREYPGLVPAPHERRPARVGMPTCRCPLSTRRALFALASARGASTKEKHGFPASGSIHYTRFADIARDNEPQPTPDIDMLAQAFRTWAMRGRMDLRQPRIDKAFIGFWRKWRPQ